MHNALFFYCRGAPHNVLLLSENNWLPTNHLPSDPTYQDSPIICYCQYPEKTEFLDLFYEWNYVMNVFLSDFFICYNFLIPAIVFTIDRVSVSSHCWIIYILTLHFLYSSSDGNWGSFPFVATIHHITWGKKDNILHADFIVFNAYLIVRLIDHMAVLILYFADISILFSKITVLLWSPIDTMQSFPMLKRDSS